MAILNKHSRVNANPPVYTAGGTGGNEQRHGKALAAGAVVAGSVAALGLALGYLGVYPGGEGNKVIRPAFDSTITVFLGSTGTPVAGPGLKPLEVKVTSGYYEAQDEKASYVNLVFINPTPRKNLVLNVQNQGTESRLFAHLGSSYKVEINGYGSMFVTPGNFTYINVNYQGSVTQANVTLDFQQIKTGVGITPTEEKYIGFASAAAALSLAGIDLRRKRRTQ